LTILNFIGWINLHIYRVYMTQEVEEDMAHKPPKGMRRHLREMKAEERRD